MRLFLVRHGETVDNVAGLYAGVRDSALTAHGALQAQRLAAHLASRSRSPTTGPITHIFSSDLQRAAHTAQAVIDAITRSPTAPRDASPLHLVKVPDLRERNFGSAEGKRFGASRADSETHEAMRIRAERFVRWHLAELLAGGGEGSIVVVSHGLMLNSLLRVMLARYAPGELDRLAGPPGVERGEYLTVWSNTGYLEMVVKRGDAVVVSLPDSVRSRVSLLVIRVNVVDHLEGLKKTRGGIGSAQFDNRQRTLDSFLTPSSKKPRLE
ncbi:histidine phosphatase superfamily [Lasiosphaeria hispida]|uniref:Histidine phosphatase superfamily n=1 Tax=Lasiosphaeria hispida TaxID=260671 RepID=A0AAJ0H870_9PEZI|nr:histidine phosphatase superfamily [Lasiosphaeria hispida]